MFLYRIILSILINLFLATASGLAQTTLYGYVSTSNYIEGENNTQESNTEITLPAPELIPLQDRPPDVFSDPVDQKNNH